MLITRIIRNNYLNYIDKLLIEFSCRVVAKIVPQLNQEDVRLV